MKNLKAKGINYNNPEEMFFASNRLHSRCSITRCNDLFDYYIIVEDGKESSFNDVPKFCNSCHDKIDRNRRDRLELEYLIKSIFPEKIKEKSELEKIKDQLNNYYGKEIIKNTYEI